MERLCYFSESVLFAQGPAFFDYQPPAAVCIGSCAFISMKTRGERVPCTCPDHIFLTLESETIVTFSYGALCGHSPSSRENTIIVLSLGILG